MIYRILGAPWAGGHTQNPGFVGLDIFRKVMDLCPKLSANFLRMNSGADLGLDPNWDFQQELAKEMAARKLGAFLVFGDTRMPVDRAQRVWDHWCDIYAASGLNPKTHLVAGDDNEAGFYGSGDRERNAPRDKEGVIPPDRLADILRLARGLNTHGCLLAAPNIEAEKPESLARELAALNTLGDDLWLFDILTFSDYWGKTQTPAQGTSWRTKQIRTSALGRMRDWSIMVAAEANQEGGKVLSPIAALDQVIIAGQLQGAGWYTGYDKFSPQFSMIPAKAVTPPK